MTPTAISVPRPWTGRGFQSPMTDMTFLEKLKEIDLCALLCLFVSREVGDLVNITPCQQCLPLGLSYAAPNVLCSMFVLSV